MGRGDGGEAGFGEKAAGCGEKRMGRRKDGNGGGKGYEDERCLVCGGGTGMRC